MQGSQCTLWAAGGVGLMMMMAFPRGAAAATTDPPTPLSQLVLYGVNNDSDELIRYGFGDGQLTTIGELRYLDGSLAGNIECLGFIPSGPDKGLFAVDNFDGVQQSRLVRISPFGGTVEGTGANTGFGNVEGMTVAWDPVEADWVVYASQSGAIVAPGPGNGNGELHLDWWVNDMLAGSLQPVGTYVPAFNWWHYEGTATTPVGVNLSYNLNARPAGLLSGNLSIQNTSAGDAEVLVKIIVPVAAPMWGQTTLMGSAAITLTTDAGGGSVSLINGAPLWKVLLDAAPAGTSCMLFKSPFTLQVNGVGSNGASQNFGVPAAVAGPPAAQSLGLKVGMVITANDSMSISSAFNLTGNTGTPPSTQNLIRLDPASGQAALVMPLGQRFEGLARGANGMLYGVKDNELWAIDPVAHTVTLVGAHTYGNGTALEFAFGDPQAAVEIPGVPAAWTAAGALIDYSNQTDQLVVINPADGQASPVQTPPGISELDGIIFILDVEDPYGPVVATLGD